MRRALILAAVLAVVAVGSVQAKADVPKVTGSYTYYIWDDPGNGRVVKVEAQGTDPVKGTWTLVRPPGTLSGFVTCLQVSGRDAWLAGPGTLIEGTFEGPDQVAVFFWVHDGGTPGRNGDLVFTWIADPPDTLADMEALCESRSTDFHGFEPGFQVVAGNVKIH